LAQTKKVRLVVLNDEVKGKPVTIAISAEAVKFDEFATEARRWWWIR